MDICVFDFFISNQLYKYLGRTSPGGDSPDTKIPENFPDVPTSLYCPPNNTQGGHINNTLVPLPLQKCLKCKWWRINDTF